MKRATDESKEEDLARMFTSWRTGWRSDPARVERLLIYIRYHASLQTRQPGGTGH